jgi:hypothetical protein
MLMVCVCYMQYVLITICGKFVGVGWVNLAKQECHKLMAITVVFYSHSRILPESGHHYFFHILSSTLREESES